MAWFNRKNVDKNVLPEVEKYYDAEKRERAGLAWLLAIVSIACAVLLIMGLFFGGRWVYRKAAHTDKQTGIASTAVPKSGLSKANTSANKQPSDKTSNTYTPKPSSTSPTPVPQPAPVVPPKPTIAKPSTPSVPVPATAPTKKLANTGPANTIAIFIISVFGFAGLYNIFSRRAARNN